MYASLLVVGAIVAAAGVALVGSGVSIEEHTFDPAIITPGMVAIVGGLILIGFGMVVRALGGIEHALMHRPSEQIAEADVIVAQAPANELTAAPAIPAAASAAEPEPQPALPELPPMPKLAEDAAVDRLRKQFPTLVRIENTPLVDEADVSLLPKPPVRADEDAAPAAKANGAVPKSSVTKLEPAPRNSARRERPKSIDTFWPKRPRPGQPAVVAQPMEPAIAAEPAIDEPAKNAEPAAVEHSPAPAEAMPISILKSGVVDGMAYTLYSDGSIEAQLPQGRLRFGSIAELRTHIEQSA